MPTKRPDELPEGEDFDFEDILMVEQEPNAENRKLLKAKIRDFMSSALSMDPERMGANAILGMQSKFNWMLEQMEKLSESPLIDIQDYDDYDSPEKDKEQSYVTPTPTPTPSITPTITPTPSVSPEPIDPSVPRPSPTPTPTPSVSGKPLEKELMVEIDGPRTPLFDLPFEFSPFAHGYSNWRIKGGEDTDNVYVIYNGFFPDEFNPSGAQERLSTLRKDANGQLTVYTVIPGEDIVFLGTATSGPPQSTQGLVRNSNLKFTIVLY